MWTSSEKATACGVTISSLSVSVMSGLPDFLDAALHVEVPLKHVVVLAVEDLLEATDRVGDRHLAPLAPGEHLRRAERLAEEALDLARPEHGELVVGRQLVHPEDRDDVLEILESLQHLLDAAGDIVMLLADDVGGQRARGGGERIDCRVDAQLGNRALEHDRRVE